MTKKYDYNKNKEEFTKEMLSDTLKYQKKYGFKIGENNVAWNNESDAFRHAYVQSVIANRYRISPTRTDGTKERLLSFSPDIASQYLI